MDIKSKLGILALTLALVICVFAGNIAAISSADSTEPAATTQVEEEESGWGTVPYIDNDTTVRGEYTPFEPKEEVETFSGNAIEGNEEEELQQERIAGGAVGEAKSQVEALHGITDYSEGEYTPVYGD